ncbi:MAG: hypothetical protein R6U98_15155 [Pirellulaceae bacterium]
MSGAVRGNGGGCPKLLAGGRRHVDEPPSIEVPGEKSMPPGTLNENTGSLPAACRTVQ